MRGRAEISKWHAQSVGFPGIWLLRLVPQSLISEKNKLLEPVPKENPLNAKYLENIGEIKSNCIFNLRIPKHQISIPKRFYFSKWGLCLSDAGHIWSFFVILLNFSSASKMSSHLKGLYLWNPGPVPDAERPGFPCVRLLLWSKIYTNLREPVLSKLKIWHLFTCWTRTKLYPLLNVYIGSTAAPKQRQRGHPGGQAQRQPARHPPSTVWHVPLGANKIKVPALPHPDPGPPSSLSGITT